MVKGLLNICLFLAVCVFAKGQDFELDLVGQWHNNNLRDLKGQIYNDIWGWEGPDGREYVILGSIDSTYFIEVTFPEKPILRDVVAGRDTNCIHRDFKTYGKYCYGVADEGQSSLQIFDMSYLPDSVHLVYDSDTLTRLSHNIFISNGEAFLATNFHKDWGRIPMTVLNLEENPEDPKAVSHLGSLVIDNELIFTHVHDVYVKDNIAYCSNGSAGLFVYDISDRTNGLKLIAQLTTYPDQGYNHSTWLTDNGKYLAMADETHGMKMKMVDVSDLSDMKVLSTFGSNTELGSIPHNPIIVGDKCFVSYYHDGLVVFDISDPTNVFIADAYDTYPNNKDTVYNGYEGCWGVYPLFSSGLIAASDMTHGLFLFKTKNWDNPLKKTLDQEQQFTINLNRQKVNILFKDAYQGSISIQVFNLKGQLVQESSQSAIGRSLEIELDQLSLGTYILKVETEIGAEVVKVVRSNYE